MARGRKRGAKQAQEGAPKRRAIRPVDTYRTRARAQIYLKDPLALSKKGNLPVGYAFVGGDTSIAPGPTSSRFMVVDYDATSDRVYPPAHPKQQRLVQRMAGHGERLIDFRERPGRRGEAQINAWATAVDTLELHVTVRFPNGLPAVVSTAFPALSRAVARRVTPWPVCTDTESGVTSSAVNGT